jgi:DHA2 family multidrug resistance protein
MDPRFLATTAFAIFAVVMLMRSHFNTQVDFETLMIPTVIQGAALAFFFIPLVTITLSGISPQQMPAASGLSNFLRISAGSFGTSISTTLWDHRATMHHAQMVEKLTPYDPATSQALANLQAGGLSPDQALAALNRLVDQQAALLSANDIFYASALLFLLMIGLVWLSKPAKAAASAEAAGAH